MKKLLIVSMFIPSIAFASWWNPTTWGVWGFLNSLFSNSSVQISDGSIVYVETPANEPITKDTKPTKVVVVQPAPNTQVIQTITPVQPTEPTTTQATQVTSTKQPTQTAQPDVGQALPQPTQVVIIQQAQTTQTTQPTQPMEQATINFNFGGQLRNNGNGNFSVIGGSESMNVDANPTLPITILPTFSNTSDYPTVHLTSTIPFNRVGGYSGDESPTTTDQTFKISSHGTNGKIIIPANTAGTYSITLELPDYGVSKTATITVN